MVAGGRGLSGTGPGGRPWRATAGDGIHAPPSQAHRRAASQRGRASTATRQMWHGSHNGTARARRPGVGRGGDLGRARRRRSKFGVCNVRPVHDGMCKDSPMPGPRNIEMPGPYRRDCEIASWRVPARGHPPGWRLGELVPAARIPPPRSRWCPASAVLPFAVRSAGYSSWGRPLPLLVLHLSRCAPRTGKTRGEEGGGKGGGGARGRCRSAGARVQGPALSRWPAPLPG